MTSEYYKILEVSQTATMDEIKSSYRRLAIQYHPDKNPNNPIAEEKFKQISEAYTALTSPKNNNMGSNPYDELSSILHSFYRQFDIPIRIQLQINIIESIIGTKKTVNLSFDNVNQILQLEIGAGIKHGEIINYNVSLASRNGQLVKKTIQVQIIIENNTKFELVPNSDDLMYSANVSLYQAILGDKITIDNILGNKIVVEIPPTSNYNSIITIPNEGMLNRLTQRRGKLHIRVIFDFPKFTDDQLNIIKSWPLTKA